MIVDSSAVLAVILHESEEARFIDALARAIAPKMSAASYLEIALKIDRKHSGGPDPLLDETLNDLGIQLVPVTVEQGRVARDAFNRFGRDHPAKLNFGDCLTYALAKTSGEPLLFKGYDFDKTDLKLMTFEDDDD